MSTLGAGGSAAEVVAELSDARTDEALAAVRKRLAPGEAAFGVRMGTLFAIAKRHTGIDLAQVEALLAEAAYEPRLAALCILDFKARRPRLDAAERAALRDVYLDHHDRITTWDMVDRAAPRVVGWPLVGHDKAVLHALARSGDPLRRRTAMTAPLFFVHVGGSDLEDGYALAQVLATDPDPLVHKPVGIFLKHAGGAGEERLLEFLDEHVSSMPRAAVRLAVEKLPAEIRSRYV